MPTTTSLTASLVIAGLGLSTLGCVTPIRVDVLRPALFTSPHPSDTVAVIDFAIPQPRQAVYANGVQVGAPGVNAQFVGPHGSVSAQAIAPDPLALLGARRGSGEDVQVVAFAEGHAGVAQTLGDGLREAIAGSASQTQTLVPQGGSLVVSGQVGEASYTETLERRPSQCERRITDERGRARDIRVPCIHIALRWETQVSAELIIRDAQGQVLYSHPFHTEERGVQEGDYEDPNALSGGTADPELYVGQILSTARIMVEQMRRHVVPYYETWWLDWLDANGLPPEQQALHDQARDRVRREPAASLELLNQLLGGEATPETSENPVAIARVLANRAGLRMALGQYDKALDDMVRANAWLSGCVRSERMRQAQTLVREQATLRDQGVVTSPSPP